LRQKQAGKSDSELVNNFIPYVICVKKNADEKVKTFLSEKAFSPDELLAQKGKLVIDTQWYITQQVMPPITRLIEHIDGINVDFVA
jgi:DNA polymerase alpha subunit A